MAIQYAKELNGADYFKKAVKEDKDLGSIYDEVMDGYYKMCNSTSNLNEQIK